MTAKTPAKRSRKQLVITVISLVVATVGLLASFPYATHAWSVISGGETGAETGMALGIAIVVVLPFVLWGRAFPGLPHLADGRWR